MCVCVCVKERETETEREVGGLMKDLRKLFLKVLNSSTRAAKIMMND